MTLWMSLLGFAQFFRDDLDVHGGLGGIALAMAVDPVLPHEHHGVGYAVQRHGESPAMRPQHLFVVFDLFLVVVKSGHRLSPLLSALDLNNPKVRASFINGNHAENGGRLVPPRA